MEGEKSLLTAIKATLTKPSWVVFLFLLFAAVALFGFQIPKQDEIIFPPSPPLGFISGGMGPERRGVFSCSHFFSPVNPPRKVARSIADFGGVGDGATSNTAAFRRAMEFMETFRERGGAQLNVPPGRWLTGSFNLTSNFTLFLERGALILGSQDPNEWPIIQALPSYGRGRERLGGRHISLIHGNSLSDVGKMEQSMGRERCGGTFGGTGH